MITLITIKYYLCIINKTNYHCHVGLESNG